MSLGSDVATAGSVVTAHSLGTGGAVVASILVGGVGDVLGADGEAAELVASKAFDAISIVAMLCTSR